jgi:Tol biopolymer transport system component
LHKHVLNLLTIILMPVAACAAPNGGWDAVWSPDGSTIAFISGSPHSIPNLWVINPDGTNLRQMTSRGAHEPIWLPDGKTIIFGTIRSGEPAYMSIEADGAPDGETPVDILPPGADDPVWSPDGSLAAFAQVSKDGASRDLWFARAAGGGSTGLTTKFWVRDFAWAPDGTSLAFVVGKATGTSLWSTTLKEKDMRLIYKGFCAAPAYSPDKKRLAIATPDTRSGFKIVVIDLEKRTDKLVAVRTFDGRKITWSPDGSRLFFAAGRKSEASIWSVGSNGKDLRRLTPSELPAQGPALSSDGMRIAFHAHTAESYSPELYVCDSSGADPKRLTRSGPSYWAPVWSPDGKKLAYRSDLKHARELFVSSSPGRGEKAVAPLNDESAEALWLPDSRKLLIADGGRLLIADTGKGAKGLKPVSIPLPATGPSLSGDRIYFTEWQSPTRAGISSVKLDGTGRLAITRKPEEPEPKKPAEPDEKASAGVLVASSEFFAAQSETPSSAPPNTQGEVGNPHAGLGVVGPHPSVVEPEDMDRPELDLAPAVSSDGKCVAFVRQGQVWLVGVDGSNERQLTQFKAGNPGAERVLSATSWSPEGDALLFHSFSSESGGLKFKIWLCGTEPGSERLVYSESIDTEYAVFYEDCTYPPAFAPDGQRILFTSIATPGPRIMSVARDGSDLLELVPAPSSFPSLDPSGRRLAYVDLSNDQERVRIKPIE